MENRKYDFTGKVKKVDGMILREIFALRDFADVKEGDVGGYISKDDNLSHDGDCWVYHYGCIANDAKVSGNSQVHGIVLNDAEIVDSFIGVNAEISDRARIINSHVNYCLICEDVSIENSLIDGCIMKNNIVIRGASNIKSSVISYRKEEMIRGILENEDFPFFNNPCEFTKYNRSHKIFLIDSNINNSNIYSSKLKATVKLVDCVFESVDCKEGFGIIVGDNSRMRNSTFYFPYGSFDITVALYDSIVESTVFNAYVNIVIDNSNINAKLNKKTNIGYRCLSSGSKFIRIRDSVVFNSRVSYDVAKKAIYDMDYDKDNTFSELAYVEGHIVLFYTYSSSRNVMKRLCADGISILAPVNISIINDDEYISMDDAIEHFIYRSKSRIFSGNRDFKIPKDFQNLLNSK